MTVALLALFVALSGTAVAAKSLITKSSQIKNGIIESADLRDGRAVNTRDLTPAARRALRGAAGTPGAAGAPGPAGVEGAQGPKGETGAKGETGTVDTSGFYDKAASDARFVNTAETATDSARLGATPAPGWTIGTFGPINNNSSATSVNQIAYGRRVISANSGQPVVGVDGMGQIQVDCAGAPADTTVSFVNASGASLLLIYEAGGTVSHDTLADGGLQEFLTVTTNDTPAVATLQVGRGVTNGLDSDADVATFIVTVLNAPGSSPGTCTVQAQAIAQQGAQSAAP